MLITCLAVVFSLNRAFDQCLDNISILLDIHQIRHGGVIFTRHNIRFTKCSKYGFHRRHLHGHQEDAVRLVVLVQFLHRLFSFLVSLQRLLPGLRARIFSKINEQLQLIERKGNTTYNERKGCIEQLTE